MKKKKVTIRDVAREAGVSYQTVSRVINNNESVADETRKRVQRAMEDLLYRPSRAAQILSTSRSRILELIIVDVNYTAWLAGAAKSMARAAKPLGYSLLVAETDEEGLANALASASDRLVDGVVLYAPTLRIGDNDLLELCGEMPLVRRDYVPDSQLAWVGFDQVHATRLAIQHLLDLGHRHIAAIPPTMDILNGYWRHKTWQIMLDEHGLQPGPFCEGDYSIHSGYQAALQILSSGETFTAIVIGTDNMAVGALRALREKGRRVPDDVSVVSFDNVELAVYLDPPLTTVDFNFVQQNELAVNYLIELLAKPTMDLPHTVLTAELIVRESTGPAKRKTTGF